MMKKIHFTKMAGAGNDFVIVEARRGLDLNKLAAHVCDRTNGIGADGLLALDKSRKADYRMHIINADGSTAEMCGNGARCLAGYIVRTRKPQKKLFSIETLAGIILGEAKGKVTQVRLSDPRKYQAHLPIHLSGRRISVSCIDTGVPHTVVYVNDLEHLSVEKIGQRIRFHSRFKPHGTNVNFVEPVNQTLVKIRTYERGVEKETKACGTGSVAAEIITYLKNNSPTRNVMGAQMNVKTAGNEILKVTFDLVDGRISNVWLKGSANLIAEGEYYV